MSPFQAKGDQEMEVKTETGEASGPVWEDPDGLCCWRLESLDQSKQVAVVTLSSSA